MEETKKALYDIEDIKNILPHRYPFLLIDKVISMEDNKIVALKNVTYNEEFFQGHFPEYPIMPGVLVLEAMAQTGGILIKTKNGLGKDKMFFLVGCEKFKWSGQVKPGDALILEMELVAKKSFLWKMQGRALVDGKVVASGIITAAER